MSEEVIKIINNEFNQNTYLYLLNSIECIIIDPGLDCETIDLEIERRKSKPLGIICTHGHFDHIASVSFFKEKYSIPYYLHELDVKISKTSNFVLKMLKIGLKIKIPIPDILISTNSNLKIGKKDIKIMHTPGHTPGSCSIRIHNYVFTGDTLFRTSIGHSKLPGQNFELLKKSLKEMIHQLPKSLVIYPGHGDSDILQNILECNIELQNIL